MNLKCPRCDTTWQQLGNQAGHCSGCHRTFASLDAFDAHQRIRDGRNVCLDPATLTSEDGKPRWKTRTDRAGATVWQSAREFDRSVFSK